MKDRRKIGIFLTAVLVAAGLGLSGVRAQAAELEEQDFAAELLQDQSITAGQTVELFVNMSSKTGEVNALDMDLSYDGKYLTFVQESSSGIEGCSFQNENNVINVTRYGSAVRLSEDGMQQICKLVFKAKKAGKTEVKITSMLADVAASAVNSNAKSVGLMEDTAELTISASQGHKPGGSHSGSHKDPSNDQSSNSAGQGTAQTPETITSAKTGDTSKAGVWIVLALAALCALVLAFKKKKKQLLGLGLVLAFGLFLSTGSICVQAAEAGASEEAFLFQLAVDGKDEVSVNTGDVITVAFTLKRTDAEDAYTMYAMQDEIAYDSRFFELVEGSVLAGSGIETRDLAMRDDMRRFYMNYLSVSGGDSWQASTLVGSFQLKVIGTEGSSVISNEDCLVSYQDGSGSYPTETQNVMVVVSTACKVHFETNGGSVVEDVTAVLGEKLTRPEDPVREGCYLAAWCTDMDLEHEWDFSRDTVSGNMTLYAKWAEGEKPAESGSSGIIVLVVLILAAAGAAVWFWMKRKKQNAQ